MRSEHRPQVDFVSLSAEVQVAMPDATAAIVVGSAVTRSHSISDLDVTAFSVEIPRGTDRALNFTHRSKPVHVVAYHPDYFDLIFADNSLYLLYYRELRKLREGRVLFDKQGFIKRLLEALSAKPPPREQLRPLVSWLLATPEPRSRAEFLLAVERLAFCWLHSSAQYRYAKPKWLLEDSRAVRSPKLGLLLEKVSQEFLDHNNPHASATKLKNCGRKFLRATSGPGLHFANNLSDTGGLLATGRTLDAVWPLRMAGAMLAEALAGELKVPYSGIGDLDRFTAELSGIDSELSGLIANLFLLNHDVASDLRAQYAAALRDFNQEWNRGPAIPAVPVKSDLSSAGSAPEFISGNGLWLQDAAGETYLDGVSGTFNLPFGYSHPKLTAAVADQLARLTHISSAFADAPAKSLIARLVRHAGGRSTAV